MKHLIEIPIGDASGDGHDHCERFIIESTHDLNALNDAYERSCKLTGLQFDTNGNYTGVDEDWPEFDKRKLCNDYLDSEISKENRAILESHGIKTIDSYLYEPGTFLLLVMDFVKLSLPHFEFKVVDKPTLPSFDRSFGYGIMGE